METLSREKASSNWAQIHEEEEPWRRKIVGEISEAFIVPRYVEFFYEHFGADKGLEMFEISAGTGDISRAILAANRGQIARYRVSEYFPEGVSWLNAKGLDCIQADAQRVPLPDGSFDVVVEFDVMHHVLDRAAMAREMMRLGRSGRCLMVESNGLSLPRKIKELFPSYKRAGETSFTPRQWRRFFEVHPAFRLTRFELFPFLFPFKVPRAMLRSLVRFNRAIEKVPLLRWQCSSVAIYLEYERL
jgi:SAM-dependent methyltransferase